MNGAVVDLLLRVLGAGTALMLLAMLALWLGRCWSAAVRHRILVATMTTVLLVPIGHVLLPGWNVPLAWTVFPDWTAVDHAASPRLALATDAPGMGALAGDTGDTGASGDTNDTGASGDTDDTGTHIPRTRATAPRHDSTRATFPARTRSHIGRSLVGSVLLGCWMAVALALLARILLALRAQALLYRRLLPLDNETQALAAECAARGEFTDTGWLHLDRRRLGRADVPMPMVCGIVRPFIVLPLAASAWPASRRRSVLLHELAHVARRDTAFRLLAAAFTACLWWHPMAWWLKRQVSDEQERAADDLVLAAGVRPDRYAAHVLAVAASRKPRTSPAAAAFAGMSRLETRLRRVLDPGARRNPGRGPWPWLALFLTALPLATATNLPIETSPTPPVVEPPMEPAMEPAATQRTKATSQPTKRIDKRPAEQISTPPEARRAASQDRGGFHRPVRLVFDGKGRAVGAINAEKEPFVLWITRAGTIAVQGDVAFWRNGRFRLGPNAYLLLELARGKSFDRVEVRARRDGSLAWRHYVKGRRVNAGNGKKPRSFLRRYLAACLSLAPLQHRIVDRRSHAGRRSQGPRRTHAPRRVRERRSGAPRPSPGRPPP